MLQLLPPPTSIIPTAAIATFGLQGAGFLVASALQTEVFYDILGGSNFLLLALMGYYYPLHSGAASSLLPLKCFSTLFCASRGWLLGFLAWRAHNRKGDARFDGVKNNPPVFFVYWMVQACWVFLVSMPLLVLQSQVSRTVSSGAAPLSSLSIPQYLLLGGFALSILMEIAGDIQKTLWIQRGRVGGFCTNGLWKYSRHPNYAGEILQWWFAAAFAIVSWYNDTVPPASKSFLPWISLVSPLFTMQILLNVSGTGIWNAEGKNQKRFYENDKIREKYIRYRATTPPLFPLFGVPYEKIPLPLKRFFCFEWNKYEYDAM